VIFLTVGAQMAFDRLVRAVDGWAARSPRIDLFGQIGPAQYEPSRFAWTRFVEGSAFLDRVRESKVIVAHAGMGTILTALEIGKPILLFPRRGDLRETRNDHQIATAKRFADRPGVYVAFDEEALVKHLDQIDTFEAPPRMGATASAELMERVRMFIHEGR